MTNAFRDYTTVREADVSRARGAALTDLVFGVLLGVLVWPFPVMRIVFRGLADSEGAGWAFHVPVLLLFMVTFAWLCTGFTTVIGRRTVGMYFADLGFPQPPGFAGALAAACPWTLAGLAALVGARGPAERLARDRLGSTKTGE